MAHDDDAEVRRLRAEVERLRAICVAHDTDPEGCVECFLADVEERDPGPLPHGIRPNPNTATCCAERWRRPMPERAGVPRPDEAVVYRCEWVGSIPTCREPATGYAGSPKNQHPLCAEHLRPDYHPRDVRLRPDEPITAPCQHAVRLA